jgi:enamine deaminase RidA (YjgF/YER057c/UK114 family)
VKNITPVNPDHWPRPSGYSNGVVTANGLLFIAGQIGWNAEGVFPDDFIGQVRQALENIVTVLAAAGGRPDQITRLTWYVTDRQEYKNEVREVGAAYRDIIGRHFPAMAVVEVSGLIEDAARVEIEATAYLGDM